MVKVTLKRKFIPNTLAFELPAGNTKEAIINVISKCKEKHNDYVQVTIDTPKKPRTSGEKSQNSHIHGHAQQIANETGNDIEDVKNYCKERAIRMGYPTRENNITGQIVPLSSANIDTVQAGYLIEELHILAGELDIILKEE